MKSVVVHIGLDGEQESRYQVAVEIVRAFEGHLTCVQTSTPVDAYLPVDPFGGGAFIGDSFERLRKAEEEDRARYEEKLKVEGVNWDWHSHAGSTARLLVSHGWLADLVVVSAPPADWAARLGTPPVAAEVAVHSRTPVLVVPEGASSFDCEGAAVIAWNGSPEACQAVRMALPLLKRARSVTLVAVEEKDKYDFPPLQASVFLSRHGVASEIVEVPAGGKPVTEVLRSVAADRKAAYVVMGAYGQSRWQESLLGGVSRDMLIGTPLPLLLAH
ncbi:MAG: universal stress protein [Novosphingobium sp.]|nr:universal stress protein [Novosphingobium sp.]